MNIKYRRIYYTVAILIFLIIAPIILFYSLGYRYDWQRKAIFKIGAISLESNPTHSDIYLNGLYQGKTNTLIQNLKPGQHTVEVKKEDYLTWQKTVEVYATKTTIFRDIVLFKNQGESNTVFSLMKNYGLNKNKDKIAYQTTDNQLWLSDLDKQAGGKVNLTSGSVESYWWSNYSNYLLIKIQTTGLYYLIDVNSPDIITNLSNKIEMSIEKIKWDDQSDANIFFTNQNKIFKLNTTTLDYEMIKDMGREIFDIKPQGNNLYLLYLGNQGVNMSVYSLNSQKLQEIFSSTDYTSLTFLDYDVNDELIFLYDNNNENLLLTSTEDGKIIGQFKGIKKIYPSKKSDRFLFFNEHELWIWDKKSEETSLLTRYVSNIADAILFDDYYYAIFITENKIKAIEFDSRNRLTQDIFEANAQSLFMTNQKDLYYIQRSNENQELFDLIRLNIR